jgi:two-component system, sensor histidine kinase and response regulator
MKKDFDIVLVEDSQTQALGFRLALEKYGYHVTVAQNGLEAMNLLLKGWASIVITDWIMPEMDGSELCRAIRKHDFGRYVYIILLTARDSKKDIIKGLEAGADDYLTKPADEAELIARIAVARRIFKLEQSLKQKQQEFYELNQIKNKFIGIAAHDLRNPIISIRGFSELLLKDPAAFTEDQREFLSIIHSTSRNMLAMLNDLLDISLIESGKLEISKKPGSLKKLIQERIRLNSLHAQQKHIAIHQNLENAPMAPFDPQRIGQAVDNLITNAIKFAPYGSEIYLNLTLEGDSLKFSVRDEGPGIPACEQPLLFNEFHRLSIQPTAGETSTGLGLSITKKIMEAHGGGIAFESQEGIGSTFTLILPINPSTDQKSAKHIHPLPQKVSRGSANASGGCS